MALYDHYTVTASTIKVRFANEGNSRPYCAIAVRDSTNVLGDLDSLGEYGNKVLSSRALNRVSTTDESGSGIFTSLFTKCDIAAFLGRKSVLSDPECKGGLLVNPTEQAFYHVIVGSPNSASGGNVNLMVEITYDVVLHEPKQPVRS